MTIENLVLPEKINADFNKFGASFTQEAALNNIKLLNIKDLEERPIVFNPNVGDVIPSNAVVVVDDYPYGSYRCMRAMWIENNGKKGYRTVTCTSKFFGGWNANKNGTYNTEITYFKWDEANHVTTETFRWSWCDAIWNSSRETGKKFNAEEFDNRKPTEANGLTNEQIEYLNGLREYLIKKS